MNDAMKHQRWSMDASSFQTHNCSQNRHEVNNNFSSASEGYLSVTYAWTEKMDVDIPVANISSPTSELTLSEEKIKRILLKCDYVAIRSGKSIQLI